MRTEPFYVTLITSISPFPYEEGHISGTIFVLHGNCCRVLPEWPAHTLGFCAHQSHNGRGSFFPTMDMIMMQTEAERS